MREKAEYIERYARKRKKRENLDWVFGRFLLPPIIFEQRNDTTNECASDGSGGEGDSVPYFFLLENMPLWPWQKVQTRYTGENTAAYTFSV